MMVVAVASAVKMSMDAKRNAAVQRENAIAQQKIEQEALLKKRAELGDKQAMEAFEKSRKSRIDEARVKAAYGEQGATTGNAQIDSMLQGLGFGQELQRTADARSANSELANVDMQLKGSGINFTNRMRSIDASDPSGMSIALGAAAAGANAYADTSKFRTGGVTPQPKTTGNLNAQAIRGV